MAKIHPYKGYLNTQFQLYANGLEEVSYQIVSKNTDSNETTNKGLFLPNRPHSVHFDTPGLYVIKFSDGSESEVTIEDGYKFGGSAYKTSFIFDEIPWCFVIMNDRTYFYNRETDESYVEAISPDVIEVVSRNYILLKNEGRDEYTIYSLNEQRPILNVNNLIFYNDGVVICSDMCEGKNEEEAYNISILSIENRKCIKNIVVNKYIIDKEGNALIYIFNDNLYKQSLNLPLIDEQKFNLSGNVKVLVEPSVAIAVHKMYNSSNILVVDTREDKVRARINVEDPIESINNTKISDKEYGLNAIKAFKFSKFGCKEAKITVSYVSFHFYVTKWDIYYSLTKHKYERGLYRNKSQFSYMFKSLSNDDEFEFKNRATDVKIQDNHILFSNYDECLILSKDIQSIHLQNVKSYIHNKDVIITDGEKIYTFDEKTGLKSIYKGNASFDYFNEFGIVKDISRNAFFDISGHNYIGSSVLWHIHFNHLQIGNDIILQNSKVLPSDSIPHSLHSGFALSQSGKLGISIENSCIHLCYLDAVACRHKEILSDIYDSTSYKSVLLSDDGSKIMYRDDKQTVILDVKSNVSEWFDNGSYIKDINGIRPLFSHRPGSLQPRIVNPVTGQLLPHNRMTAYQFVSPNGLLYADTEIDKYVETWDLIVNKILSDSEIAEYADKFFYIVGSEKEKSKNNKINRQKFLESNFQFFKDATHSWKERSDKQLIDSLLLLPYADFAKLFMKRKGVAYIRQKTDDSIVAKIELGNPLWFLNYVSFSYDNRFVAIAGRYPNDSNYGGLFLVYDLINKEEIIAKRNSWAVWMTSFNQQNHVAAYSSEPISYDSILSEEGNGSNVESYPGYSFLTFSPSGEYAALSNQGYVSKYDRHGNERLEWGHMPSCEVYVVRSSNFGEVLVKFSDLSKSGIDGLADKNHSCSKTVTSVSFSNDNKHLMMVGNDGVVVIRNLHLDDHAE